MKIRSGQKLALGRRARLLLCLCVGMILFSANYAFPQALAATSSRLTVTQAVSQDKLSTLSMKSAPSPVTLQDFTRATISKLSAEAPFTDWKDAATEYYPLGPGTHSWLVNVLNGEQRIGYLIISSVDQGGYMLSEYGAGSYGLPYSLTELRQFLVQEGLIPSSYSGSLELTALYAPLLPVWKLTTDSKTLYINASILQVLPWSLSKAGEILKRELTGTNVVSSLDKNPRPLPAYRSGGQDDPYADLLWLTVPSLTFTDGENFKSLLAASGSLAFQSAGRNDTLGAPFMITGYQSWRPASGGKEPSGSSATIIYAASGPEGKRYLPLSALLESGTLHKLPLSGNAAPGAAAAQAGPLYGNK